MPQRSATVELRALPYAIAMRIEDDGRGFDPKEVRRKVNTTASACSICRNERKCCTDFSASSPRRGRARPSTYAFPSNWSQNMTDSPIRVLITDDHKVLREGLRLLLNNEPDLEVVAEAADGRKRLKSPQSCSRMSL
jgi:hypothetical protein